MIRRLVTLIAATCFLAIAGCGGGEKGPEKYTLSGKVSFAGKPVPVGYIQFYPDPEKGNSGPGTGAKIEDGAYETPGDKGIVGGPHVVEIRGYDGVPITVEGEGELPDGTELFPLYKTTVDLPKESGTRDFDVPGR